MTSSGDSNMLSLGSQGPTQQNIPSGNKETERGWRLRIIREWGSINMFCGILFWGHLFIVTVLAISIAFHGLLSVSRKRKFDPKSWTLLVFSSTLLAGILGFVWQTCTNINPFRSLRTTFWLSPFLACSFGVLLVSVGTPGSLAASVLVIVTSILQALYACWVTPRFENAGKILAVSLAYRPPKLKALVAVLLVASTLYTFLLMAAIGGAMETGTKLDDVFIFLILVSYTWTMQMIKTMVQVTVSHLKYTHFASGVEQDLKGVLRNLAKNSMGTVCLGSIIVPFLVVLRGLARTMSSISRDADEFMFSCASCCKGVASRIIECGNRWSFVHVGVYNKGIVQASSDTWEIFTRAGIQKLIDSDLTSAFCFLCGTAAGSACALVAGAWALAMHKTYATQVSIYAFLGGYFLIRVAMAWIQASVTAYYVAYAENPRGQQFDSTIPDYIRMVQRSSRA